ncbi:MAG: hypothetical protein K2L12_04185 [Clostridia bacterium]|nr:hypothetical protein [Clostridia bacterium]
MNEEELDYAEMLEIPVSTVNVVKKKSIFKRKGKVQPQPQEDLKERVVESVNERVGAYVYSEDLSDPPKPEKVKTTAISPKDNGGKIVFIEAVAVALIAIAIFVTNILIPNTVINTFLNSFSQETAQEPAYTEFKLTSVTGDFSDAEVAVSESGVLSFTAEGSVYPICKGTVSKITSNSGIYTVEIAHTSTFKSVITGLTNVYSAQGTKVAGNIPVGYSDGNAEVRVSMYDNETLLNCYTLTGAVPVWKS